MPDARLSTSEEDNNIYKTASNRQRIQPLEYEYLTYETELPHPLRPAAGELPEEPNLKKYSDPMKWSWAQKQSLVWQSVVGTTLTAYSAGTYTPPASQMAEAWHVSNVAILVGITVFTIGFGVAPMVLAPFSELNGRRPVFVVAGIIYLFMSLGSTLTHLYAGMLVVRLLAGITGSVFSTMVGGVITDIYETKDRNTAMAMYSGGVIFGTGLGPLVGGVIAYHASWRWVFGVLTIAFAVLLAAICLFFRETRGSVLLSRKAKKLNAWYEACENVGSAGVVFESEKDEPRRLRWKVQADEERASIGVMVKISSTRPFILLFTEPTVFFFSLWVSFSWAILYLQFSVIPYLFRTTYDFNLLQSNAIFTTILLTAPLATLLAIASEKAMHRFLPPHLLAAPEARLYPPALQSVLLPLGLFWLGWSARPHIHWISPACAIACAALGIFAIYLAAFNYLADAYGRFASSAIAGQSLCRNLLAGAFPLFAEAFFRHVGVGPASSVLGAVGVVLTGVPWVLVVFGPGIRRRSRFARAVGGG